MLQFKSYFKTSLHGALSISAVGHLRRSLLRTCFSAALLSTVALASAFAQGTWSQIAVTTGSLGDASGMYYQFNGSLATNPQVVSATDTATYPTMSVPVDGSGNPETTGGYDTSLTCSYSYDYPSYWTGGVSPYRSPSMFIRSNAGPPSGSYKGLAFYGSFNITSIGTVSSPTELQETVFFGENACYAGGREYGVVWSFYTNELYFYAATYANCTVALCGTAEAVDFFVVPSGSSYTNSGNYYFEIWPEAVAGSPGCGFAMQILGPPPNYTTEWSSSASSNPPTYSAAADSSFCTDIQNESGAVTAGLNYAPTITGLDSTTAPSIYLSIGGLYVGK